MHSALYFGEVMHKRLRPFAHRFVYRVFSLWIDLDELPVLHRRLRLFSHNRLNLFGFHDRDHGARDGSPLRPWIEAQLAAAGRDIAGGPVRLLCFPRVLGYVFNPLTLWFCHRPDGTLDSILYEVRNTFGDKHGYLIPLGEKVPAGTPIRQACDKEFYVSPFIGPTAHYRFKLREPGEDLSVAILEEVPEGPQLVATQTGRRAPLSDATLLRAFLGRPLLSLKVIGGIHWEALRLWLKGAAFHRRTPPPRAPVTILAPQPAAPTPAPRLAAE
jgi:DUF1365 family protein